MKESQRIADALDLDLVQKANYSNELRLYKNDLVVILRAKLTNVGPPAISIASIERTAAPGTEAGAGDSVKCQCE